MIDLANLLRLEREATPPEWSVKTYQDESGEHNPYASWDLWREENMMLVVALRNAAPELLAEVARLRERCEALEDCLRTVLGDAQNGELPDTASIFSCLAAPGAPDA